MPRFALAARGHDQERNQEYKATGRGAETVHLALFILSATSGVCRFVRQGDIVGLFALCRLARGPLASVPVSPHYQSMVMVVIAALRQWGRKLRRFPSGGLKQFARSGPDLTISSTKPGFGAERLLIDHLRGPIRLRTLTALRWLAVFGQTTAILFVHFVLGFEIPLGICLLVIAASAWLNLFTILQFSPQRFVAEQETAAFIVFDIIQLCALLFLTGGLQNPFSALNPCPRHHCSERSQ